jgi:hypothetical protein
MAWLISRDVVPRWFAEAPPAATDVTWIEREGREFQYGIFGDNGLRIGTAWSVYQVSGTAITRIDTLQVAGIPLTNDLRVQTVMDFLGENELDEIEVHIIGVPAPVALRGARQGPKFAFQVELDHKPAHEFVLDADAAQTLGDTIRPFSVLEGLQVGRSWTVHVVDPFSLITGSRGRLREVVVLVTGQEYLEIGGRKTTCFIVEAAGARAWVNGAGRVLRQDVEVPGMGLVTILEEDFRRDRLDVVSRQFDVVRYRNKHD